MPSDASASPRGLNHTELEVSESKQEGAKGKGHTRVAVGGW